MVIVAVTVKHYPYFSLPATFPSLGYPFQYLSIGTVSALSGIRVTNLEIRNDSLLCKFSKNSL